MFQIQKIKTVELPSVKLLSECLDNYDSNDGIFKSSNCDKLYMSDDYDGDNYATISLEHCELTKLKDEKILNYLKDSVEYIKTEYGAKVIWLNVFIPNTKLFFHTDHSKNRHLLTLNENERFFNYECFVIYPDTSENKINHLNQKLDVNDLDNFNDYFLKMGNTKIINLEKNSVYTFGNTVHTFINGSNKLRCAFVFDC